MSANPIDIQQCRYHLGAIAIDDFQEVDIVKIQITSPLVAALALLSTAICWRGIWGLFDVFLFPENRTLSYLLSILLGVGGFLVIDRLKPRQE